MDQISGPWGHHRLTAVTNAKLFLQAARTEIDRAFGDGHAENNPDLVATFMDICARSCEDATNTEIADNQLSFSRDCMKPTDYD